MKLNVTMLFKICLLLLFSFSCIRQEQPENKIIEKSNSLNDTILKQEISKYTFIRKQHGTDTKVELLRQLKIYLDAQLNGDFEVADKYMHPFAWDLLKETFPDAKNKSELKEEMKNIYVSSNVKQLNKEINMQFLINGIIDTLSFGKELIYTINCSREGHTSTQNLNVYSPILAISNDNGVNWQFMGIDNDKLDNLNDKFLKLYPPKVIEIIKFAINNNESINKLNDYVAKNSIEKSLIEQFNNLFSGLMNGDSDKVLSLIYDDVFLNLQKKFKDDYDIDKIRKTFFYSLRTKIQNTNEGYKVVLSIDNIQNKVEFKTEKIYKISYALNLSNKNEFFNNGGEAIAITNNNGKSWKFFEVDSTTVIEILSINHPPEIINKIIE